MFRPRPRASHGVEEKAGSVQGPFSLSLSLLLATRFSILLIEDQFVMCAGLPN